MKGDGCQVLTQIPCLHISCLPMKGIIPAKYLLRSCPQMVWSREISGLVFSAIQQAGRLDIGALGAAHDSPMIASWSAARLQAMLNSWEAHPRDYLPAAEE